MTNEQALKEAQERVDSFKHIEAHEDEYSIYYLSISELQDIAHIAIDREIKDFEELTNSFRYKYPHTVNEVVYSKLSDLQQINEQINNTI